MALQNPLDELKRSEAECSDVYVLATYKGSAGRILQTPSYSDIS